MSRNIFSHPVKDDKTNRWVCTAKHPMPSGAPGPWLHPSAKYIKDSDGYPGGDFAHYVCPHCGKEFKIELAQ